MSAPPPPLHPPPTPLQAACPLSFFIVWQGDVEPDAPGKIGHKSGIFFNLGL